MITGIVAGYPHIVAPPSTVATHWRVIWAENFGDVFATCAELSFRGVTGGPNLAVGGVAIASSAFSSGEDASKAFDGNSATSWSSNGAITAHGQWLGYIFPTAVSIVEIAVTMSSTSTGGFRPAQMPRRLVLQYSVDGGGAWETAGTWDENPAWVLGETKVFSLPTTVHRYWRILWDANFGGEAYISCGELSFRSVSGGANLGDGSYALSSTNYSTTYSASEAFDSNLNTAWSSDGTSIVGQWLGHGFTSLVDVVEVGITMKATSSGGFRVAQMPKDFRIQRSDDLGMTWTTMATYTNTPAWTFGETKVFAV